MPVSGASEARGAHTVPRFGPARGNLPRSSRLRPAGGRSHGQPSLSAGRGRPVTVPEHCLPPPTRTMAGQPMALNSPCTAGKSCSARDLNQLRVCLLVVCLMTTTVGEAYLVRTIGRRSESQSTRPKSVLSGSPRARQCRTACRPSWRWHRGLRQLNPINQL